ncbi:MAG: M15 family metallopeptidase [Alistipes sp.]
MKMKWFIVALLLLPGVGFAQKKSAAALQMEQLGLINIAEMDPSIRVDLMYAKADNFTGRILYTDLREAYLHPDAAQALLQAQNLLRKIHPSYRLFVCDASRPMSIQQVLWDTVKGTPSENYASNPAKGGGTHNYGFAVDVTIYDVLLQDTITMGVKVDHLFSESNIDKEDELVRTGKISAAAKANRELLRYVMTQAGYRPLRSEYWHFNYKGYNRDWLRAHGYKPIK